MMEVVLPHLKETLASHGSFSHGDKQCFHYQRPPTIRVQPFLGQGSPTHNDEEYGHQSGEVFICVHMYIVTLVCITV
jgi:hypothetical protein